MTTSTIITALELIGTNGWVEGETFTVTAETAVVIGRSRSCDISLRRIPAYLNRPAHLRDADHAFNTVSRQHVRLTWSGETVLIEDCSTNGTLVNGQTIVDQIRIPWDGQPIEIRLGTRETMLLRNCERSSGADEQMPGSASAEASAPEPRE